MTELYALWLPVLISAVIVFVTSAIIHTVLPWHKGDYATVPNETQVSAALRPFAIPPGDYIIPRPATREGFKSPEFEARIREGPNLIVTVLPNAAWSMTRGLGLWFVYCLLVSVLCAIAVAVAVPTGYIHGTVFHAALVAAFLGYCVALWQMSIWWRRSWAITAKATVDGLIYALLTAGTFVWLWPR